VGDFCEVFLSEGFFDSLVGRFLEIITAMKKNRLSVVAIIIVLLSACSTTIQQDDIQVSSTPTILPTVFSTKTASPQTIEAKPTVPIVTIETPTFNPVIQDKTPSLSVLLPNCNNTEFSPDNKWAAGYCENDETWILGVNQTARWKISYGEYYGKKFDSGGGSISPYYWTLDGQYLFLRIDVEASGPIYFIDGWGLIRLDLVSGHISEILSPAQHDYYSFSLSPDGKYLAYILQPANPLVINIVNLKTGDIVSFGIKAQYNQAGRIIWSPNKSKIVFGQATIDDDEKNPNLFSVVVINLANGSRQTIVQDNPLEITPKTWVNENTIELKDIDGKSWIFNLQDNSLLEKKQ
jgi:hypothetical protein